MQSRIPDNSWTFEAVVAALLRGDFTLLAPVFQTTLTASPIREWVETGKLATELQPIHEAATCAAFLGNTELVEWLLDHGADPIRGAGTGMNALHWACNRGQRETVLALLARDTPLELRNQYGGTVLGATVWAAVHEPRPMHLAIIEALLTHGADVREAEYPSGSADVDQLLRDHGAT